MGLACGCDCTFLAVWAARCLVFLQQVTRRLFFFFFVFLVLGLTAFGCGSDEDAGGGSETRDGGDGANHAGRLFRDAGWLAWCAGGVVVLCFEAEKKKKIKQINAQHLHNTTQQSEEKGKVIRRW